MIWMAMVGGAAAFAHCLGMCGPFVIHLTARGGLHGAANQALWHTGRITTYAFLGALAGLTGQAVGRAGAWPWAQDALAWTAGGVMILMGLVLLGVRPWAWRRKGAGARRQDDAGAGAGVLTGLFRQFLGRPGPAGALVLGLATGFLPCPIVLAGLALAAGSASAAMGMALMAAMGAGTIWSLLLLGLTGQAARFRLRRWGPVLAGAVVLLMGTVTVLRGTTAFHHLLGCPAEKAAPACCGGAGEAKGENHEGHEGHKGHEGGEKKDAGHEGKGN